MTRKSLNEMHIKNIIARGLKVNAAKKVLIMLHGRSANADDILSLSDHLHVNDFAILAPEATNNTWYPYSFLAPPAQNEPWLSSALKLISELVNDIIQEGISKENI